MCDPSHEDVKLTFQEQRVENGTHSASSSSSSSDHSVSFNLPMGTRLMEVGGGASAVAPTTSTATTGTACSSTACSTPTPELKMKMKMLKFEGEEEESHSNASGPEIEAGGRGSDSNSWAWLGALEFWTPKHWCCVPKESSGHDSNQLTTSLFQDNKAHPSIRIFEPDVEDQVWDTLPAWRQMAAADWSPRCSAAGVGLSDGRLLVMGGTDGQSRFREVWRSTSFGHWQALPEPPWAGRMDATAVALPAGEVLLMGGEVSDQNAVREVWRSQDAGMSWQALPKPAWHARARCAATVLPGGQILVMGGVGMRGSLLRDVWLSEDGGLSWIQQPEPPWTSREAATAVSFSNRDRAGSVRLIGGFDRRGNALAEIWRTDDLGCTWEREWEVPADWLGRGFPMAVPTAGNVILTLGGVGDDRKIMQEAWGIHPDKGASMEKLDDPPFQPRGSATVVSSCGSVMVFGGMTSENVFLNDVWCIDIERPCLSMARSTAV